MADDLEAHDDRRDGREEGGDDEVRGAHQIHARLSSWYRAACLHLMPGGPGSKHLTDSSLGRRKSQR